MRCLSSIDHRFPHHPTRRSMGSNKRMRSSEKDDDREEMEVASLSGAPSSTVMVETGKNEERAARKAAKRALEQQLWLQIPTHDNDGIPYGKIQLRRMKRRVKHGLSPIPTEEEESEIRERERRERIEDEALYYEAAPARDDDNEDEDEKAHVMNKEESDDDDDNAEESQKDEVGEQVIDDKTNVSSQPPPIKKVKRNKPVPSDYICQACQTKASHWIYDCPQKETKKGCNTIAKKLRGLHDPPSRKVFVSGLPFDCEEGMVKHFFDDGLLSSSSSSSVVIVGEGVVHVKLLKFEDSKRCKGQAFLTFDTDEGATMAINKMNGSVWKEVAEPGISSTVTTSTTKGGKKQKKKTNADDEGGPKRELRLKVTRALNRCVTGVKKTGGGYGGGRAGHENALKRIGRKSLKNE